ncbi:general transcription factor 3C polypeptide 6 [Hetaerina americana]|uniref:general transcription factor 3C polypeptide 6 n=1 Tax=Hetaerina americana TaxID=62018 RepID=UPI003A7F39E8
MSGEDKIVEEEYLVYAELCDCTDPNILNNADASFKSFAFDSDQPLLTIGGQAFVGRYKDTVGTAVFFEEIPPGTREEIGIGKEPSDPLFVNSPSKKLQYVCHTRKSLEMSRVLLVKKTQPVQKSGNVVQNEECAGPSQVASSSNQKISGNVKNADAMDESHNLSVDCAKIALQDEALASPMEESQIIENIEKLKIMHQSDE